MQKKYLSLLTIFSIIYAVTLYATPISRDVLQKYHLTLAQVRILYTFIIIPLVAIWSIAFYGSSVFETYARAIGRGKDGAGFRTLVRGVVILSIGTPAVSVITGLIGYYSSKHLAAVRVEVILSNYLTMLVALISFYFIYQGALQLSQLTRKKFHASGHIIYNIVYIGLAVLYTYVFLAHLPQANHIPLTHTSHAAYYTSTPVLITTLLIPYLVSWYLGSLSIYLIGFYNKNIGGTLYSQALQYISYGLGFVVAGSVFVQLLTVYSGQVQNLSTTILIILIYCLLAIISAGYIPIAIGAKRLAAIEKV